MLFKDFISESAPLRILEVKSMTLTLVHFSYFRGRPWLVVTFCFPNQRNVGCTDWAIGFNFLRSGVSFIDLASVFRLLINDKQGFLLCQNLLESLSGLSRAFDLLLRTQGRLH